MPKVTLNALQERQLVFEYFEDVDYPMICQLEDQEVRMRLNDFPAEPMWTVFVNDERIGDIDNWPPLWARPSREDYPESWRKIDHDLRKNPRPTPSGRFVVPDE